MVLDLNKHMMEQREEKAKELQFCLNFVTSQYVKIDFSNPDMDHEAIVRGLFKAARALMSVVEEEEKKLGNS